MTTLLVDKLWCFYKYLRDSLKYACALTHTLHKNTFNCLQLQTHQLKGVNESRMYFRASIKIKIKIEKNNNFRFSDLLKGVN